MPATETRGKRGGVCGCSGGVTGGRWSRDLVHHAEADVHLQFYEPEFVELPRQAAAAVTAQEGGGGGSACGCRIGLRKDRVCRQQLLLQAVEHEARLALAERHFYPPYCARVTVR